ncbi:MAG: hypothetical protein HQL75_16090 [Magnetococcales bacterium]|nr:hypothetical protein [Magnetococcales bacterium]
MRGGPGKGLFFGCVMPTVLLLMLLDGRLVAAQSEGSENLPVALGRLFTTPRQRVALDHARRRVLLRVMHGEQNATLEAVAKEEKVALNGLVIRSGGPPAVWMDGNSAVMASGELPDGVDVVGMGRVQVVFPRSGRTVTLQVGQRFDGGVGRVLESYEMVKRDEAALKGVREHRGQGANAQGAKESGTGPTGAGATTSAVDRLGLGADGAALSEMMQQRAAFQNRLGGLQSLMGQ